jgi:diaminopropionate ammonia-lyase
MLLTNPRATRRAYPAELQSILSIARAKESQQWLSHWSGIHPGATPLHKLSHLAGKLGIARLQVKDESARSPLGSFKALGAPIALIRLILRLWPGQPITPAELFAGAHRALLSDFTVISATDGNHGKALAAAARDVGCPCVIVLHAHVNSEREAAIAAQGARIVRIAGNYDDSVAEAARLAAANGWHVVSDTSYPGYEDIPRDVMQGYATLAAEVAQDGPAAPFTHVFLQGGVGGLAAGVASYFWQAYGAQRPAVVIVEPEQADCLYQSARQGVAAQASGNVDSVMAGLACGETSPLAWRFLDEGADHFMTVPDAGAVRAMRVLARGGTDIPIVAGESGAAGLAGLMHLLENPRLAAQAGLDGNASVLLINSEGATAPALYEQLVGDSAEAVLMRQRAWLAAH